MAIEDLNRRLAVKQASTEADANRLADVLRRKLVPEMVGAIQDELERFEVEIDSPDRTEDVLKVLAALRERLDGIKVEPPDLSPIVDAIRADMKAMLKKQRVEKWTLDHERNSRGKIIRTTATATYAS